ncbi:MULTISPECIES: adenylate kinase [unclassified Rathayibacter]|uniref:adenylate kinase n=1 Tax=unclassified Rathayibacter TaxID=2609250 RepID=UPI00188C15CD|nr:MULTISPECIES: adenylate kinase [unclassified Rathayibacter]MBF4462412.1 adenylate kinase [Rathayibacter sp. VKM Ac-2879]MBF4503545.1 adenylate kinase [Rathayibacter sp. VKM Ac-2878]
MRVIMMGPPGVGKGTQAALLAAELGVPTISTGELFRAHVADGTELGRRLRSLIEAGEYVPDEMTNALVAERLDEPDVSAGFILDGYPRTSAQVDELDRMLAARGAELSRVVLLEADTEVVLDRLRGRSSAEGRADDDPEVVRTRIEVYHRETAPLHSRYDERGLLARVDGTGAQEEVAARVAAAVRHE